MIKDVENTGEFLFYSGIDGSFKVEVIVGDETVWLTQKSMSELFDVDRTSISKHISNIYTDGELEEFSTCAKNAQVRLEGNRTVRREVEYYNLDMIIAVGYRVNSYNATQFRIWATNVLKEYLIKGFSLDDERLKQGKVLFGKDFFGELLERIREIRASERRFYQKITDIYKECSIDYDPNSKITKDFYATVQNKLHWAIHHHTAAELIKERANYKKPNMGLTTWKNIEKNGKVLKEDVVVAKNYLNEDEIKELNRVVTMYLDFAENMAIRKKPIKMAEWVQRLDAFLQFNEYDILQSLGGISADVAKKIAIKHYDKFRIIQDREYQSDFDKIVAKIKETNKIPSKREIIEIEESGKNNLSEFNKSLKKAIDFRQK